MSRSRSDSPMANLAAASPSSCHEDSSTTVPLPSTVVPVSTSSITTTTSNDEVSNVDSQATTRSDHEDEESDQQSSSSDPHKADHSRSDSTSQQSSQQQSSDDPSTRPQGDGSSASNPSSNNSSTIEDMETVERLEKYSSSEIIFHRQVASRSILETFHEVRGNQNDLQRVAAVVSRFANDSEPSIRAELAEQLPQIACFCLNPTNGVPCTMSNITLPIIEQFLSDSNSQVRKITQNSLCFMLEQNIIDLIFIEDKISPILVHLMDISNLDDFRIEAVTTVSKIIRFLGKEVTERIFLQHYSRLCSDVSFHVRRVCASNIGEVATVVGQSLTESILLPQFKSLCEDGIWGVRKACADVFVPVSCVCSNQVRRDTLGPLFVGLLCDQSKWVKTAAFQALGPFISTFADPRKTGLYYNDGGVIVVGSKVEEPSTVLVNGTGSNNSGTKVGGSGDQINNSDDDDVQTITIEDNLAHVQGSEESMKSDHNCQMQVDNSDVDGVLTSDSNGNKCIRSEVSESMDIDKSTTPMSEERGVPPVNGICDPGTDSSFNTFQFWRVPIPDLKPVLDYVDTSLSPILSWDSDPNDASVKVSNSTSDPSQTMDGQDMANLTFDIPSLEDVSNSTDGTCAKNLDRMKQITDQDTIPPELLEHYLNMTSPGASYDSIDNDLTHHCAFSLPAVAMTLGRRHWPCLRDTFESLTLDMQWKVRWTLASSLHQMAQILGPEYTSTDLLPAFLAFMKDLDEVRYGVLQNLSSILKILNRPEQLALLPRIGEFMKMDNPRNWRFRSTLAHQIHSIVHLYSPLDIKEHLLPLAFTLLRDKVSEVRISTIKLLSTIMRHFYSDSSFSLSSLTPLPDPDSVTSVRVNLECLLISELTSLVDSTKWIYRQVFVFLVEQMITDRSLPTHIFNDHFIPPLLTLNSDRVPNVRMALSRCLVRSVYGNFELFEGQQESVLSVLHQFSNDPDSDVKRFASMIRIGDKKVTVNGFGSEEDEIQAMQVDGEPKDGQKIEK